MLKWLPKPELPDMEEAPADEWEEKTSAIWQRILKSPALGIHSDYFLSGGDSPECGIYADRDRERIRESGFRYRTCMPIAR